MQAAVVGKSEPRLAKPKEQDVFVGKPVGKGHPHYRDRQYELQVNNKTAIADAKAKLTEDGGTRG